MEQKLIDRFGIREIQELNDSMKQKRAMERLKEEDVEKALKHSSRRSVKSIMR